MIVNKVNDVPAWFYLDNPNVKTVSIGTPSKEEREWLVKGENFASFFAADVFDEDYPFFEEHPDELEKVQDRFVGLTEGFSFTEINGLRRLCKNEKTRIRQMSTVIDLYRYGIKENPWDTLDVNELKTAKEDFQKRVKGQDFAIVKTLDVVKRAVTGMAGLQSSSHAKPKGILFFAGPTGTGKTETAKTLAEKLFGDESCCIRFDMSEYSLKNEGKSMGMIIEKYIGKTGRKLFMLFCWLFTLLVIAAFTDMVAGTFVGTGVEGMPDATSYANSAAASISMLFIVVAVIFGVIQKHLGSTASPKKMCTACLRCVCWWSLMPCVLMATASRGKHWKTTPSSCITRSASPTSVSRTTGSMSCL